MNPRPPVNKTDALPLSYSSTITRDILFKLVSHSLVMYAETHRPTIIEDVIGHADVKEALKKYLTSKTFPKSIL